MLMDWELVKYIFAVIYELLKNFYHSGFFLAVKIFLGLYSILLFVDIVLLLFQRGLSENYRRGTLGMDFPLELTKKRSKTRKRWEEIKNLLKRGNESLYKVAVIEGDNLIDEYIRKMGYGGSTAGDRLENVLPGQIENVEDLKEAHKVRNRVIHEEDFQLTKSQAEEVLAKYEQFLRDHDVLD